MFLNIIIRHHLCRGPSSLFLSDFSVVPKFSCIPNDWNAQIELNKYGNFTLSGCNLMGLVLNQSVSLDITYDNESKYPASYIVNGYSGVSFSGEIIMVAVSNQKSIISLQKIVDIDYKQECLNFCTEKEISKIFNKVGTFSLY